MLHILLLILKIIGILLLVLLLLILLLFLTVSLSPLCYRAEGSCRGNPDTLFGKVRFHWLFHLLSGEAVYDGGEVSWRLRIAWKHMGGEEEEDAEQDAQCPEKAPAPERQDLQDTPEGEKIPDREAPKPESTPSTQKEEKKTAPAKAVQRREDSRKEARGPAVRIKKKAPEKESLSKRFEKYVERLKYTFRKFCDKMKVLTRKKDRLKAFIESEVHRNAFFRVLKELKRFLGFLRPKKLDINVEFGCRNPEYTGYILAGISMIYPMIGEFTQLQPNFEQRILKGNAYIEGKFRIIYVLITAWNLIWDKNVRITYRHIRKFKL